jgi:cobalt-zinc-cadmium efflux system outer membrane protein
MTDWRKRLFHGTRGHGGAALGHAARLFFATALGCAGCATVDPKPDYERVGRQIETATGQPIAVDPTSDVVAQERVAELLADGLTTQEAVQVALLNNPRLQAALLRIGIGRAAVVQSGLFSNPSLALSVRLPDEGGLANFEVSLAQNIAELWQIRPRGRAAEKDLEHTILIAAREASTIALDAHAAYVRAVQMESQLDIARRNLAIAEQLVELALGRKDAGSGTEVDVNLARAERATLDVSARTAWVAQVEAKSALTKLLGLALPPEEVRLTDRLPDAVELPFTPRQLIELARAHRTDLKAADAVIEAAQARVSYERSRFLRSVELGISVERDARRSRGDRDWLAETAWASAESGAFTLPSLQPREPQTTDYVTGPTLSMELPLFDQNQAQVARAEFELLQALHLREAIDREIVQEAWAAHARAQAGFESARFIRDDLLPLRENGLTLAREAYRVGATTVLTVLDAQRRLLEARAEYVQIQAAAGLARIDIERIAGQPFSALTDPTESKPSPESQP